MPTILLVDDSKMLLKHIERVLTSGGYSVVSVSSGQKAVQRLVSSSIDLVLTDLFMPPPDGFELVDAVRALPNPPPLVVMSSNAQACDIFRAARQLGAYATLEKPFSAEKLLETVGAALAQEQQLATAV